MKTTVEIGRYGEAIAEKYLKKQKFKIVGKNIHISHEEIDIIAENKEYIIFVEVKTRSCENPNDMDYGRPALAVNSDKKSRTFHASSVYMLAHPTDKQPRIDVIEVYLNKDEKSKKPKVLNINHIENAFYN